MLDTVKLENHYSLPVTLDKLNYVLTETGNSDSLKLLNKAVCKAREDEAYASAMEDALLRGSTVELREWLSAFGDYMESPRASFPWYPHHDAVNGIDSAMGAVKREIVKPGAMQEAIDFINLMRS